MKEGKKIGIERLNKIAERSNEWIEDKPIRIVEKMGLVEGNLDHFY